MAAVAIEQVWRRFGPHVAVSDLNLKIADGEFVVLLGPSGCGKTTSLRMLAGLERPSSGLIKIDEAVVNDVPAGKRDIAMVFQSYALYPHMTVRRNLTFGPRIRREDKAATERALREVVNVLGLEALLDRRPNQLSGGQRQRVALGRAMLRRPKLFLLDEPLSNLDAALRGQVRAELVRLHRQFPITTVYVTHDQVEAMTMADKIAVMFHGRLQQVGTPQHVFDDPDNRAVATFIGSPPMNILPGTLSADGDGLSVTCLGKTIPLPAWVALRRPQPLPLPISLGIRATDVAITTGPSEAMISGRIDVVEPMGAEIFLTIDCGSQSLICRAPGRFRLRAGETVSLAFDANHLYAFDPESGEALIDRSGWNVGDFQRNDRLEVTHHG
ncbi:MAG TPA: ABC transporter ATP-binding protein [Acetobacteraceae bacterium]|nr:ABC transporter ATP-binding protein [Acetobacteraceae bacterium]